MSSTTTVVRAAGTRFLPIVAAVLLATVLAMAALHPGGARAVLRMVSWPLLAGQPVAVTAGYALGLWLLRGRLARVTLHSAWRAPLAATLAVVQLELAYVVTQDGSADGILATGMLAGIVVAFVVFGPTHYRRRNAVPAV